MLTNLQSLLYILLIAAAGRGAPLPPQIARHDADVIYGRKDGTALTMDVIQPHKPNGCGVIFVVSGGWFSAHNFTPQALLAFNGELIDRGYTVFAVVHGSQPRYAIPDAMSDVNRAVRFIQTNAARWHVDPDRLGIVGGSAGGHLSLCIGLNPEKPNPKAPDPVDRASGRVRAVAAWFPPTDFLNYGEPGKNALGRGVLDPFYAAFEFREMDPKLKRPVVITDEKRREEIGREISPAYHVDSDDPPVLLIHGDKDVLVPLQQSKLLEEKLKAAGVEVKLVVRPGKGHGWAEIKPDTIEIADWFDAHLLHAASSTQPAASQRSASTTQSTR